MKVLVTGGAGYIGSSLINELDQQSGVSEIVILDNLSRIPLAFFLGQRKLEKVKFVEGDILDGYTLEKILPGVEMVYHLAAFVSSPYNYVQNIQFEQINKWGTLNLVRAVQDFGKQVQRFVFLSSAAVYGLRGKLQLNTSPQPSNAYGKSKLAAERFARLLAENMPVDIIRSGNVFGYNPCFRQDAVLNNFIFNAIVYNKVLIYGDGNQGRPFVSLSYLVKKLLDKISGQPDKAEASIEHVVQFNANVLEIRDWLQSEWIPQLEYTMLNTDEKYDGQIFPQVNNLSNHYDLANEVFKKFYQHIRLKNSNIEN